MTILKAMYCFMFFMNVMFVHLASCWDSADLLNGSLLLQKREYLVCWGNSESNQGEVKQDFKISQVPHTSAFVMLEMQPVHIFSFGKRLQHDHFKMTRFSKFPLQICHEKVSAASLAMLLQKWEVKATTVIMDGTLGLSDNDIYRYLQLFSISATVHNVDKDLSDVLLMTLSSLDMGVRKHIHISILCSSKSLSEMIKMAESLQLFQTANISWIFVIFEEDFKMWTLVCKNRSMVDIHDVFSTGLQRQTEILKIGEWTYFRGIQFYENIKKVNPTSGLKGREFRFAAFHDPPFVQFRNSSSLDEIVGGYVWEILQCLSIHLNFKVRIIPSYDGSFGAEDKPNNFSGIVGCIQRREADVTLSTLVITAPRKKVLKFTTLFFKGHADIFFKKPTSKTSLGYFLIFSKIVWSYAAALAIFTLTTLTFVKLFSPNKSRKKNEEKRYQKLTAEFLDDLFISRYSGLAARVILGTFLFATLITFQHYTAKFTSFLTAETAKMPFTTLEDVVRNKEYHILLLQNTNFFDTFKDSKEKIYKDLWQQQVDNNFRDVVKTKMEAVEKISNDGNFVYFGMVKEMTYLRRTHPSVLPLNNYKYFWMAAGWGTRKDFPYHHLLSATIQRYVEHGLIERVSSKYFPPKHLHSLKKDKEVSFTLSQVAVLNFVLLGGFICAFAALAIEVAIRRYRLNNAF